ncbi:MAG TPA: SDR family oxidoreductase [Anaerovoracaceae bacterium]|nr:SDR family oxidoreductase [Anaerovoracaceae bacterium]
MVIIDLSGKTAIVTGAGRGIGRGIASRLAEAGADVVAADLNEESAKATSEFINGNGWKSIPYKVDISSEQEINGMVEKAVSEYGRLDIIVNNAGIGGINYFMDTTSEEFDKFYSINLKGVYYGCKAAIPHMIKAGGGHIVNTSSLAGLMGPPMHALYSTIKYGILGMTRVIATECGQYNIKANALCPGFVNTEMWADNIVKMQAEEKAVWENVIKGIPLKRAQTPEDMANTVLFLCSDLSDNITGQAIVVDGGAYGSGL